MPRKEPYKPRGKGKKTGAGTRAWLTKHKDGRTKLPVEKMSRYQIVGKTPTGKLKIEIVVNKDGFMEGIGAPKNEISEEDWNKRFTVNAPKEVKNIERTRKKKNGGVVVNPKGVGKGSGQKKKEGKAAAKIQRAVRRRLKRVKGKRAEQVAREEKYAPELREKLGKAKPTAAPLGKAKGGTWEKGTAEMDDFGGATDSRIERATKRVGDKQLIV